MEPPKQSATIMMMLRTSDFMLTRFAGAMSTALKFLGDAETDLLERQLNDIALDRPVFIAGLARSGSTILLSLFSALPAVATHRYRDFPFLFVPHLWNRFQSRLARTEAPVERPHQDRNHITKDSSEAFEEPLWMHFFPFVHDTEGSHILNVRHDNLQFNKFYLEHLRKILLLRGGKRYVSKGNYNVARLEYILHLLPDARFVVPIRHPIAQVDSLVHQHHLFTRYSEANPRVPAYMRAAGHYEFGPQRAPINLDEDSPGRISTAWAQGRDELGYAVMWQSVYGHVLRMTRMNEAVGSRIRIVRYEDLCADPRGTLDGLFQFCEMTEQSGHMSEAPAVCAPSSGLKRLRAPQCDAVWQEVAPVAKEFGYNREYL